MAYSRALFDFQLRFARRLVERFDLVLLEALYHYTTFTKGFGVSDWADYIAGLARASDAAEWTYQRGWHVLLMQPSGPISGIWRAVPLMLSRTPRRITAILCLGVSTLLYVMPRLFAHTPSAVICLECGH